MPASKKQIQSILITLAVAVVAIAGFLLVMMGRLSAPDTIVDGREEPNADSSVAVESETEATVADTQPQPPPLVDEVDQSTSAEPTPPEDIIATVNNQIITRRTLARCAGDQEIVTPKMACGQARFSLFEAQFTLERV